MTDRSWYQSGSKIIIGPDKIEAHCKDCADKIMLTHRNTEHKLWEQLNKYIYWDTRHLVGVTSTFVGATKLVESHNERALTKSE